MAAIEAVRARVQSLLPEALVATGYFRLKAGLRGVDVEQAKRNIIGRPDGFWKFSQHAGLKGTRLEVFFKVSSRKLHKYILEANEVVYLVNVIVVDGKKQRRLRGRV